MHQRKYTLLFAYRFNLTGTENECFGTFMQD